MGCIAIRGTRKKPKYYVQFKDADGKYKMRALKGARTKEDARKVLAQIEARVAAGRRGFVDTEPAVVSTCGPLLEQWRARWAWPCAATVCEGLLALATEGEPKRACTRETRTSAD